jgi:uncharacterized membrane protein
MTREIISWQITGPVITHLAQGTVFFWVALTVAIGAITSNRVPLLLDGSSPKMSLLLSAVDPFVHWNFEWAM